MLAWAFVDSLLVQDQYPQAGDHTAGWETPHMMALHPETVDLSMLPPEGEPLIGIGGAIPPQRATADFGHETMGAAAVAEVHHRLQDPHLYRSHGHNLREGLWRQ
jgi:creatinine amidohydrolase